jgi:catechol 2,3-dioxygenase-like lactoylglutathione lyase family enzyme
MDQRISLVTLGVTDLSRARSFYEALGWGGAQQPDDEVCFFQAGGMVFGLWTALGGSRFNSESTTATDTAVTGAQASAQSSASVPSTRSATWPGSSRYGWCAMPGS